MSGWKTKALAEICEIRPAKAEARRRLQAEDLVSFVPMNDLSEGSKHFTAREARPLSAVEGSYTYFAENDVLLAKITPCFENGKLGIARDLINGVGFGSSEFVVLRPGPSLDPEFLFYFLSRASFREEGAQQMTGAVGHKRIPKDFIEDLQIPTPPRPEQRRIVTVLDEAFAGLATIRANVEANLKNARALFDSHLNAVLSKGGEGWVSRRLQEVSLEFGRGRSRHRPRNATFLYGGPYPFIQTGDVRNADHFITEFSQTYSAAGLAQSKLWPAGTICITIAANIAETGILGFDACFPDSVIGIVVDPTKTNSDYVEFLLQSVRARLKAQGKGSAQDNINLATFENEAFPFPPLARQRDIVETLNTAIAGVRDLEAIGRKKLAAIDEMKQSILAKAFAGKMTSVSTAFSVFSSPSITNDHRCMTAVIMARAFARHQRNQRHLSFGHVKAQKTLHMVEAAAGFELGRAPRKDAAGPNDMPHMMAAERWAEDKEHFKFPKVGEGYRLEPLDAFDALLRRAEEIDATQLKAIDRVIDIFIPMDTREAELFATVYAAWNNLLIDRETPADDAIIREAREDWHREKLKIDRAEFVKALAAVRKSGMIPTGTGKRVGEPPQARFL